MKTKKKIKRKKYKSRKKIKGGFMSYIFGFLFIGLLTQLLLDKTILNENAYYNIRRDLEKLVDIIIHEMIESLSRDEAVEIRGWGRIKTGIRKARVGRNPKNSEKVQIPQKKMIKWKMSKILYNKLNNNFTEKKISATY